MKITKLELSFVDDVLIAVSKIVAAAIAFLFAGTFWAIIFAVLCLWPAFAFLTGKVF